MDVIVAVWSNLRRSPSLGGASECQSGAETWTGVGAMSIGDLIKAQGACLAPYSYRLPVSHLVPATVRVGS